MNFFDEELDKLKQSHTYRQIPDITEKDGEYVIVDGKKLLNLSSNDYLNLSTNEELAKEFTELEKSVSSAIAELFGE